MAINEEICDFDKWKMFGKRVDKATNKAMMDHQGNNKDTTSMDVSNTNAVTNFLQVSEQIERHHAQMWTRQQKGAVGNALEKIGKRDAQSFTEKLTAKVNKILPWQKTRPETRCSTEERDQETNKGRGQSHGRQEEAAELGDEAPSSPI